MTVVLIHLFKLLSFFPWPYPKVWIPSFKNIFLSSSADKATLLTSSVKILWRWLVITFIDLNRTSMFYSNLIYTFRGRLVYCTLRFFHMNCNYTVFQKKHVTTFSMMSWSRTIRLQRFFGTLITKCIGHWLVYLVSHLTYFVQLLYLGKLSRLKYHEFSLKFLIFSMLQY